MELHGPSCSAVGTHIRLESSRKGRQVEEECRKCLKKRDATASLWHTEQNVSLKENANCYQREQNVIVSNPLGYKNLHKTCPNKEQKRRKRELQTSGSFKSLAGGTLLDKPCVTVLIFASTLLSLFFYLFPVSSCGVF